MRVIGQRSEQMRRSAENKLRVVAEIDPLRRTDLQSKMCRGLASVKR
jgi:hypothetical protein